MECFGDFGMRNLYWIKGGMDEESKSIPGKKKFS